MLFQIPQRYRFSSKSQQHGSRLLSFTCCFRYHKGTDFQANHNLFLEYAIILRSCFRYHKGTDFQANHNWSLSDVTDSLVVLDTTKVQIFKQITTSVTKYPGAYELFQIPQRYRFSSKSQHILVKLLQNLSCFRYHKGTDFQANHNLSIRCSRLLVVVLDTTKVQIFKQITTQFNQVKQAAQLFQIPQRYRFSSKSQQTFSLPLKLCCCFRYHKGTDFQANHNKISLMSCAMLVVLDTTKVQIFKQITTENNPTVISSKLFQIPQRYRFSSKSQLLSLISPAYVVVLDTTKVQIFKQITTRAVIYVNFLSCFRYHKGTDFQANHNTVLMFSVMFMLFQIPQRYRFSSKSQLDAF